MLKITRGATFPIDITITDPAGGAVDYTASTLRFVLARERTLESQAVPLLQILSPARLTVTHPTVPSTRIVGQLTTAETTALSGGFCWLYIWAAGVGATDLLIDGEGVEIE